MADGVVSGTIVFPLGDLRGSTVGLGIQRHWLQSLHDEFGANVAVLACRRVYGNPTGVRCLLDVHATLMRTDSNLVAAP